MKKIPSVFKRDYDGTRLVYNEVVPGCEWVLNGEGVPTEKIDGTACMVRDGKLYKRFDAKAGKTPPVGWEPCEEGPDEHTGHFPGWLPVGDGPEDKWHREAFEAFIFDIPDGTYELIGPKIQGNPYELGYHKLMRHGEIVLDCEARTFEAIREYLTQNVIEGIVWHHTNGRMAKIKRRDFGLEWPPKKRGT